MALRRMTVSGCRFDGVLPLGEEEAYQALADALETGGDHLLFDLVEVHGPGHDRAEEAVLRAEVVDDQ